MIVQVYSIIDAVVVRVPAYIYIGIDGVIRYDILRRLTELELDTHGSLTRSD